MAEDSLGDGVVLMGPHGLISTIGTKPCNQNENKLNFSNNGNAVWISSYFILFQVNKLLKVKTNILWQHLIPIVETKIYMKLLDPFTIKIQNHSNFVEYFTVKKMFFLYQPVLRKQISLYKIHSWIHEQKKSRNQIKRKSSMKSQNVKTNLELILNKEIEFFCKHGFGRVGPIA
jgi:hypothetical protein